MLASPPLICERCYCSRDFTILVCDGEGLEHAPRIDDRIRKKVIGLGLQRNDISHVSREYLDSLPALVQLDISQQWGGCVHLESDSASLEIIGE